MMKFLSLRRADGFAGFTTCVAQLSRSPPCQRREGLLFTVYHTKSLERGVQASLSTAASPGAAPRGFHSIGAIKEMKGTGAIEKTSTPSEPTPALCQPRET